MHCNACARKDVLIEALERALAGAIWVADTDIKRVRGVLGLSRQRAALVLVLYAARGRYVDARSLQEALPARNAPEDRYHKLVAVVVHHIRKKLGDDFIETDALGGGSQGYRLSGAAVAQVRDALVAA